MIRMRWNGQELASKDAFAAAMRQLVNADDAAHFRALFNAACPEHGAEVLGYLTGEVHPVHRLRVQSLLGVHHPFHTENKTPAELLAIGMGLADHTPDWFVVAMSIPRVNHSLFFSEEEASA